VHVDPWRTLRGGACSQTAGRGDHRGASGDSLGGMAPGDGGQGDPARQGRISMAFLSPVAAFISPIYCVYWSSLLFCFPHGTARAPPCASRRVPFPSLSLCSTSQKTSCPHGTDGTVTLSCAWAGPSERAGAQNPSPACTRRRSVSHHSHHRQKW
jgi:hypothetical protein